MTTPVRKAVMQDDGITSIEPNAICDACGRRGTVARATLETTPRQVWRWCRKCAPREVRRFEREQREATTKWFAHFRKQFRTTHDPHKKTDISVPPASSIKWETARGRLHFAFSILRDMSAHYVKSVAGTRRSKP
jgi:hypothetical protein